MHDLKKMADACDTGHPDQTQLVAAIAADPAASKRFATLKARAALAGHALSAVPGGYMLMACSPPASVPGAIFKP